MVEKAGYRAERMKSERWRSVSYDELVERDKANLDITCQPPILTAALR